MKCMDEPRAESGFVSTLHLEVRGRGMRRRKEMKRRKEQGITSSAAGWISAVLVISRVTRG